MKIGSRIKRKINRTISFLLMLLLVVSSSANITFANAPNKEGGALSKDTPNRPFPQHVTYTEGTIKPNHITQEELDAEVRRLYDEWKEKYLIQNPYEPDQYYVWYSEEPEDDQWFFNGEVTVSEAHGYGMMIVALMAGHDPDAKELFNGLYRYFRAHPSSIHPDLMAWQQVDKNGAIVDASGQGRTSSATDGDMDIGYSLLLADKQWGSDGEINYLGEGKKVIDAIMEKDVHTIESILKLGDWANNNVNNSGTRTRPSDFMMQHLKDFRIISGDERWDAVIDKTFEIIQTAHHPVTGLLPDFARKDLTTGVYLPAPGYVLESIYDGDYYYNACRTPWRIGTDYLVTGDTQALNQLQKVNNWIKEKTGGMPSNILGGYYLDGREGPADWEDNSYAAPFMVGAMVDSSNQQWLNDLWDYTTAVKTEDDFYFGNNIRMLSAIVVSGNWWSPTDVTLTI